MSSPLESRPPVVVIGAARSGTKLVRDILGLHPDGTTIPFDVNFIWKYRNFSVPHDELAPERHLDARIRSYIRAYVERTRRRARARFVIEKTVGNTLRVDFVRAVLPEAKLIHLIRDGRDVAESSQRMWQQPLEWRRVLPKLRHVPPSALPSYALDYARSYARLIVKGGRVESWGPRFDGIDDYTRTHDLLDTCARQWERSVTLARNAMQALDESQAIELRYEHLMEDPDGQLRRVLDFLQLDIPQSLLESARRKVDPTNVGKWRRGLSSDETARLQRQLEPLLTTLGYQ